MLRYSSILGAAATAAIVSFFAACGKGGGSSGGGDEEGGSVKLYLGKLSVPMFDSITVTISAADMATIYVSKKSLDENLKIDGIPQGEDREFEVKVYADGKLVQKGKASSPIVADESVVVPIILDALYGFLRLEIPIGNNSIIRSGKMSIDYNLVYEMTFENGKGVFNTNALQLDEPLFLRIELRGENGDLLFSGEEHVILRFISQTETIKLSSTNGSAVLELTASSEGPMQILATLPATAYGKGFPENYGDIMFTEIYANPASTEDDYFQYMELYNSTSDTLQLSNCKIKRTDKNSDSIKISNFNIPPMSYAIIGRNKVQDKDYSSSFSLLKTAMGLGLFCKEQAIDTLTFSNKGENIFPLEKGTPMQLPLENYKTRTLGSSWCLGSSPRKDAICQ